MKNGRAKQGGSTHFLGLKPNFFFVLAGKSYEIYKKKLKKYSGTSDWVLRGELCGISFIKSKNKRADEHSWSRGTHVPGSGFGSNNLAPALGKKIA